MKDLLISPSRSISVGKIFTPHEWAKWLLEEFSVVDQWIEGKTVADPTGGEGAFLIAIYQLAIDRGICVTESDLQRLFIIEKDTDSLETFGALFRSKFDRDFPSSNVICTDLILAPPKLKVDILVGNPPWANFGELQREYKELLKPHFIKWGLVPDLQKTLLGGSRVDLAALILQVSLGLLLKKSGRAFFYLPMSLFFGDDAHKGFRRYSSAGRNFAFQTIWELSTEKAFAEVTTSYGFAAILADSEQQFPIRYFRGKRNAWERLSASYLRETTDPLRVSSVADGDQHRPFDISLVLQENQQPRQGINTCGANEVFLFDDRPEFVPKEYLFPLLSKELFRGRKLEPSRWIFLPYNSSTGRPAEQYELEKHHILWQYLLKHKTRLLSRKGTMLSATLTRGYWWALLGVGPYCFAPYKVAWEAYGSRDFRPLIFSNAEGQSWQANQAMHALIPCWTESDAKRICDALGRPEFQTILTEMNGGGKCNWAQPGKIKKLVSFEKLLELPLSY